MGVGGFVRPLLCPAIDRNAGASRTLTPDSNTPESLVPRSALRLFSGRLFIRWKRFSEPLEPRDPTLPLPPPRPGVPRPPLGSTTYVSADGQGFWFQPQLY